MCHELFREALHAVARRRADAHGRISRWKLGRSSHFFYIRCGVNYRVAAQVKTRRAPLVEERDVACVSNAVERGVEGDSVVNAKAANLCLGDRHIEFVVSHKLSTRTRRQRA